MSELSADSAVDYAMQFGRPWFWRERITECLVLKNTHVDRSCVLEMRGPGNGSTINYIPILRFAKGKLIDNLELTNGQGEPLPRMTTNDTAVLNAVVIKKLLAATVSKKAIRHLPDGILKYHQLELTLLSYCVTRYENADASTVSALITATFKVRSKASLELLTKFVAAVGQIYAVVVPAPPSSSPVCVYKYQYSEALPVRGTLAHASLSLTRRQRAWLRGKSLAREILCLDPGELYVDAGRARSSADYHLTVSAPEGYYIGANTFFSARTKERIVCLEPKGIQQASRPYFRCRGVGQPFAHLYTRSFRASSTTDPWMAVLFFEKLPGSLAKSWLLAAAVLIITWFFGVTTISQSTAQEGAKVGDLLGSIDPGALLLALPLTLWAITGMSDRKKIYASGLFAPVSIAVSLSLGFLDLILLMMLKTDRFSAPENDVSVLFVSNPLWIALLILALANAIFVGQRLFIALGKRGVRGFSYGRSG